MKCGCQLRRGTGFLSIRRRRVCVKDFVSFRVEQRFYVSLAFVYAREIFVYQRQRFAADLFAVGELGGKSPAAVRRRKGDFLYYGGVICSGS